MDEEIRAKSLVPVINPKTGEFYVENEIMEREDGPPLVAVRADVLLPMLVYLRKFFKKVQPKQPDVPSRFVEPEDFTLTLHLQGITPEDFNALMSLSNSMAVEMGDLLDRVKTPQMSRSARRQELEEKKAVPQLGGKDGEEK